MKCTFGILKEITKFLSINIVPIYSLPPAPHCPVVPSLTQHGIKLLISAQPIGKKWYLISVFIYISIVSAEYAWTGLKSHFAKSLFTTIKYNLFKRQGGQNLQEKKKCNSRQYKSVLSHFCEAIDCFSPITWAFISCFPHGREITEETETNMWVLAIHQAPSSTYTRI